MSAASLSQTTLPVATLPTTSEAAEFYSLLFHDDRKSNAILATRRSGLWTEEALPCSRLPYMRTSFLDSNDHYVTVNSFAGKRRDTNRCRQINAIMLDIDAHSGNHAVIVPALRRELDHAVKSGELPAPNIVVDTGRGLQLYYVFDKSIPYRLRSGSPNAKVLEFLGDVRRCLAALIESALVSHVPGAELDNSVSDLARVARIPGSYNAAAGRKARLISTSREFWDLPSLKGACALIPTGRRDDKPARKAAVYRFDRLQMSRMTKIEELVTYREQRAGCIGTRDLILFVYYNSATQVVGPHEASKRTKALNARFSRPLPDTDIEQIARTVDSNVVLYGSSRGKKGFYPLSRENIIAKLHLQPDEIEALNFFASKRQTDRAASKMKTAQKRTERDEKICKLYGNGLTQAEVATRTGCSIGTVNTVVRRAQVICGSLKAARSDQFKVALVAKNKESRSPRVAPSFFWHTSLGCGLVPSLSGHDSVAEPHLFDSGIRLRQ